MANKYEIYLNKIKEKDSNYVYCTESVCELLNGYAKNNKNLEIKCHRNYVKYAETKKENKILQECLEVMLENANCSWTKHPVRTEKESVEYVEKLLKELNK